MFLYVSIFLVLFFYKELFKKNKRTLVDHYVLFAQRPVHIAFLNDAAAIQLGKEGAVLHQRLDDGIEHLSDLVIARRLDVLTARSLQQLLDGAVRDAGDGARGFVAWGPVAFLWGGHRLADAPRLRLGTDRHLAANTEVICTVFFGSFF